MKLSSQVNIWARETREQLRRFGCITIYKPQQVARYLVKQLENNFSSVCWQTRSMQTRVDKTIGQHTWPGAKFTKRSSRKCSLRQMSVFLLVREKRDAVGTRAEKQTKPSSLYSCYIRGISVDDSWYHSQSGGSRVRKIITKYFPAGSELEISWYLHLYVNYVSDCPSREYLTS